MTIKIGIKGFGRIGTIVTRLCAEDPTLDMQVVAISERPSNDKNDLLVKQHVSNLGLDTTYGSLNAKISPPKKIEDDFYVFNLADKEVNFYFEEDVRNVPWRTQGVDVLIDCSTSSDIASLKECLGDGIKYAVVSNSQNGVDATVMVGVNEDKFDANGSAQVIASSSCTGYASAPIIKLVDEWYGIEMAKLLTIHPNQNFESSVDGVGLSGGMSRGSVGNVKAVESGVSKSVLDVLPHLEGKISTSPLSYRTPTASGSFIVFEIVTKRPVIGGAKALNQKFIEAAANSHGLIGYGLPLLSGHTYPCSADVKGTKFSVLMSPDRTSVDDLGEGSWITLEGLHDTEMGYAASLLKTVNHIMKKSPSHYPSNEL